MGPSPKMKIGVLSDTHLRTPSSQLWRIAQVHFRDVDLILHAGDTVEPCIFDVFFPRRVEAVAGNMDSFALKSQLPIKKVVEAGPFRIGLIHGWGSPTGIEERIRPEFTAIDCVVYGHTHRPANHIVGGVLFFNPGSATEKTFTTQNTVGILDINETITVTILAV
jgi:uncharacterized protein